MQLKKGVNLNIIKETKFKTVSIVVRFRTELKKNTVAKRMLISNLWETSNAVLKTNRDLDLKLSDMYGASYSTTVSKKGREHFLNLNLSIVDPKLLNENNLLNEAIIFLKNVIFNPLLTIEGKKTSFEEESFKREKKNLIKYLEATVEDRAYYAGQQLNKLYFTDENMQIAGTANAELIRKETAQTTYDYYQQMLNEDAVDIFVLGNLDDEVIDLVEKSFSNFDFIDRQDKSNYFYQQDIKEIQEITDEKDAHQSIIQMAYNLPIQYGDDLYMALQVYNGLLGGFPHSKLFMNVREKESLAYYATSSFDSFSGILRIRAGIEAEDKDKTQALITEQVESMKNGEFSEQEIEQTKKMLATSYHLAQDSGRNLIEQSFTRTQFPDKYMEKEEWLQALENVKSKDIISVAKLIKLQVVYFLKGQDSFDEEN
ncbi:hypothetical protein BG261_04835 [Floricoccus tropicus]|uniref:Peptidase M16 C-terminal domain-containing protein n=1 Tax=Floricoccus tropicus TaxID=1859473 RepID=A0A1E8GL62_9LACT|nr:pitrilysin family protein [Floricoccus tropicus]OFI48991.1 hypothetical protein BG261_04835 [Floricoccus tropicus]